MSVPLEIQTTSHQLVGEIGEIMYLGTCTLRRAKTRGYATSIVRAQEWCPQCSKMSMDVNIMGTRGTSGTSQIHSNPLSHFLSFGMITRAPGF